MSIIGQGCHTENCSMAVGLQQQMPCIASNNILCHPRSGHTNRQPGSEAMGNGDGQQAGNHRSALATPDGPFEQSISQSIISPSSAMTRHTTSLHDDAHSADVICSFPGVVQVSPAEGFEASPPGQ
jgi:hypothetical protein